MKMHSSRLAKLENERDKLISEYLSNAPMSVLKAIIDDSFRPTWSQVIAGDYESSQQPVNQT